MAHPEHWYSSHTHVGWTIPEWQHFSTYESFVHVSALLARPQNLLQWKVFYLFLQDHFLFLSLEFPLQNKYFFKLYTKTQLSRSLYDVFSFLSFKTNFQCNHKGAPCSVVLFHVTHKDIHFKMNLWKAEILLQRQQICPAKEKIDNSEKKTVVVWIWSRSMSD